MYSNCSGCQPVYNWETAERYFNSVPQPRERKTRKWGPDTRPLDAARKWHYRIERDGAGRFYDVCLYHTVMARYYKPEGDTRKVAYNYDGRMLSHQFMWCVTNSGRRMQWPSTDGRQIYVPVCHASTHDFGTELTFVNDKLDIARSKHRPIGTQVMSDEKRVWLKELRAYMANFLALMECRVEALRGEWHVPKRRTYNHPGKPGLGYSIGVYSLRAHCIDAFPFEFTSPATTFLAKTYAQRVMQVLDTADYRAEEVPTNTQVAQRAAAGIIRDLTKLYQGSEHKYRPLPSFPEELPATFVEL